MAICTGNPGRNAIGLLRVLNGGRAYPRPRMLAIDLDVFAGPVVSGSETAHARMMLLEPETRALSNAQKAGLELVIVTSGEEAHVRRMLDARGLCAAAVISDAVMRAGARERSRICLDSLVACARQRSCTLREIAVIATHPKDCPMMLEAGVGFALRDAGDDAVRAADKVFPVRRVGGLAAAVDAVVILADGASFA